MQVGPLNDERFSIELLCLSMKSLSVGSLSVESC